jgi:RNA polymerase sigma-70 factor (ECF subfamily)
MAQDPCEVYHAGRQAWPDIALDEGLFTQALRDGRDERVHAADLYLACAALQGHPAAVGAFERQHMSRVPQFVGHLRLPAHALDDLCQRLREELLLPRGLRAPKLAEYAGRGALGAWLRVVAVRAALDQLHAEQGRATSALDSELPFLDGVGDEPELQLVRLRLRERFVEALQAASQALTARERNLLRLSLVDGLTLEQMAPLFGVTKSTVHRWVEQGRRHFLDEVQRFFREELGLSGSELDSVGRLLQSQVDFSLPSLFRSR